MAVLLFLYNHFRSCVMWVLFQQMFENIFLMYRYENSKGSMFKYVINYFRYFKMWVLFQQMFMDRSIIMNRSYFSTSKYMNSGGGGEIPGRSSLPIWLPSYHAPPPPYPPPPTHKKKNKKTCHADSTLRQRLTLSDLSIHVLLNSVLEEASSRLSYNDLPLETWTFACSKSRYDTFQ